MKTKLIFAALMLITSLGANAGGVIIVHPDNSAQINKIDVARMFLSKIETFPDGSEVVPIDQVYGSDIQDTFYINVLRRSPNQIKAYFARLIFTGKGTPPKVVGDDADIIKYVANNPQSIGYVTSVPDDSSVRIITTF